MWLCMLDLLLPWHLARSSFTTFFVYYWLIDHWITIYGGPFPWWKSCGWDKACIRRHRLDATAAYVMTSGEYLIHLYTWFICNSVLLGLQLTGAVSTSSCLGGSTLAAVSDTWIGHMNQCLIVRFFQCFLMSDMTEASPDADEQYQLHPDHRYIQRVKSSGTPFFLQHWLW